MSPIGKETDQTISAEQEERKVISAIGQTEDEFCRRARILYSVVVFYRTKGTNAVKYIDVNTTELTGEKKQKYTFPVVLFAIPDRVTGSISSTKSGIILPDGTIHEVSTTTQDGESITTISMFSVPTDADNPRTSFPLVKGVDTLLHLHQTQGVQITREHGQDMGELTIPPTPKQEGLKLFFFINYPGRNPKELRTKVLDPLTKTLQTTSRLANRHPIDFLTSPIR